MVDIEDLRQSEDVQQELREVQELLERHRVVEGLVHRQQAHAGDAEVPQVGDRGLGCQAEVGAAQPSSLPLQR